MATSGACPICECSIPQGHGSHCVVFCCSFSPVDFTYILQGYFTGAMQCQPPCCARAHAFPGVYWLTDAPQSQIKCRAHSRLAPSQSETSLQSNAVSHKLSASIESALKYIHSKNKVVKWTTLGLSNWCQKRTPQSRPKLVIWMSRRMTTLMSSQKQPESRQMPTFFTGFSAIWRLNYHLRTTEWQTSNRQMMVLWLICDNL